MQQLEVGAGCVYVCVQGVWGGEWMVECGDGVVWGEGCSVGMSCGVDGMRGGYQAGGGSSEGSVEAGLGVDMG